MDNRSWQEHMTQWKLFVSELIKNSDDLGEQIKFERQLRVLEQVSCAAVINPKLLSEFIKPSSQQPIIPTQIECILDLNESQKSAVQSALSDRVLSLIQGPPGTGKTQVIAEICLQLYRENPQIRILVCSETHIAVNNLISRIASQNPNIRILRIKDKENNADVDEYSPETIIEGYIEWAKNNCQIELINETLGLLQLERNDRSLEKSLALSANIVGMTCNRVGAYTFLSTNECFDVAIVDEVCKATLPEILMPLSVAKKAVLVGDPKQLPPVFCSEELEIIRSIEKCNLQKFMYVDSLFSTSEDVILLDTQYRMTNQIGNLIGKLFYSNKLKNGRNDEKDSCVEWIDYTPTQVWPKPQDEKSSQLQINNLDECEIIIRLLDEYDLNEKNQCSVAVIAPYRYQISCLRKTLQTKNYKYLSVTVDTVDGFQGRESDMVIFSLTRTVGTHRFLADERRLNVALSRARNKIVIVGYLEYATSNNLLRTISENAIIRKVN